MHLSKLLIHGFKSFANPTELLFHSGITAIVGPNGCGKSNIVDAVRWVVGEQRSRILRSDKMGGVIFNGTATRRGLGMASVELTVQNTRGILPTVYSEVTLGRRLYRSGESEYLLNGVICRLKDIKDLFQDTGMGAEAYSVIELKMVETILSQEAGDRRRLFEEAAGITKYKHRRRQALRTLQGIQSDLTRIQDLASEVGRRVKRLERQAKAAARHSQLVARIRELTLALAVIEHRGLTLETESIGNRLKELRDKLTKIKAVQGRREALLQDKKKKHTDYEQEVVRRDRELNDHRNHIRDLTASLELSNERRISVKAENSGTRKRCLQWRKRQEEQQKRGENLCEERVDVLSKVESANTKLKPLQQARDSAREALSIKRRDLDDLSRKHATLTASESSHLREYDRITNRATFAKDKERRLGKEVQLLEQAREESRKRKTKACTELQAATTALHSATESLKKAEKRSHALQGEISEERSRLQILAEQRAALLAERKLVNELVQGYVDFPVPTRFLADNFEELTIVSDILRTDQKYRTALAGVLGTASSAIVVETVQEACRAISLLREEDKGRTLFIVLERIPSGIPAPEPLPEMVPFVDLVSVSDDRYQSLATLLLQDTYLGLSFERLNGQSARVVTDTGEWIDSRGIISGGSDSTEQVLVQHMDRKERLASVTEELTTLGQRYARGKGNLDLLNMQHQEVNLESRQKSQYDARVALTSAEQAMSRLEREEKELLRRQARLERSQESTKEEIKALLAEAKVPRDAAKSAGESLKKIVSQMDGVRKEVSTLEIRSNHTQDQFTASRLEAQDLKNKLARIDHEIGNVIREVSASRSRVKELRKEETTLNKTLSSLEEEQNSIRTSLDEERSRDSLEQPVREARTRLMENRVAIEKIDRSLRTLRRESDAAHQEERALSVHFTALSTRMEGIVASAQERYGETLNDSLIPEGWDEDAMRKDLDHATNELGRMRSVNVLAEEEYRVEKERHTFLVEQYEDLQKSETALLQTVDAINKTAAKRFMETYETIRASFKNLFRELFGKDTVGDLRLNTKDDVLESRVSVMAQPRGKRPVSISQLSSGEKTLTAIALLFAIYQVKPSPFCFLDEVDAPLDDANVDRFMNLVRQFSGSTQFVLVTHNKRTMELADRLYGITMRDQGISRVVGVQFKEAVAIAG